MKHTKKIFITFEGIDGSGKSTQAKKLFGELTQRGLKTILTREPGGSPGSECIRRLLLENGKLDWSDLTELLLFFAARRDHVEKTILPALHDGTIVICDRYTDSTRVYQGGENPQFRKIIDSLQKHVIQLEPDLTFILSINSKLAMQRTRDRDGNDWRLSRLSNEKIANVVRNFEQLTEEFPHRCQLVDGGDDVDKVSRKILKTTLEHIHG